METDKLRVILELMVHNEGMYGVKKKIEMNLENDASIWAYVSLLLGCAGCMSLTNGHKSTVLFVLVFVGQWV